MLNYIKKILIGTPAEKVKMTTAQINVEEMKIKINRNIVRMVIFGAITAMAAGAGWWVSAAFCGFSTALLGYTIYFNKRIMNAMQEDNKQVETEVDQPDLAAAAV